ncbi:GIY-YIG nuclease family protein [Paenibacillus vulneris]|uniref:GIY-YIG nuclease family protein n=1 Tax=Paenibacillus vulneris TaxID=1133364 RepID=A0ABW3UH71_9BACL
MYLFLDKNEEIIYVGKTKNLTTRLEKQHFTRSGHLPFDCYYRTETILYAQIESEVSMSIYEIYYINKYQPEYNDTHKYKESDIQIDLPELNWVEYKDTGKLKHRTKTKKCSAHMIQARLRDNRDDDLIKAMNELPEYVDKSDIIREALRAYFFDKNLTP